MKTNYFRIFLLFFAICGIAHGNGIDPNSFKGRYTKEKKIKKEFTVNADAGLRINNRYGNLEITSWNENRTIIEVTVKTNGNDEEKVMKKLEDIDVVFDASGGLVSARTVIEDSNSSWWKGWLSGDNNINMEINYTVKVPVTNSVDLDNDYGAIVLNRIDGNAKINCDYGKLEIGELNAKNNSLNFDYTNNSTIGYMKSGRINADYSGFVVESADYVELNADYSKSVFENVKDINYNCDYGSLNVEKAGKVLGKGDYLTLKMGDIMGDVNLNSNYGSIKIDRLTPEAGNVTIQSDYTGIKLGYASGYNFMFDIRLEYGGFSGEDNLEITKQRTESSKKYYAGHHGSPSAKNMVNINTEYGSVNFYEN
ncbi:MAG: hypothetical protein CL868_03450 [Cytophagaceae bacterium]|nr:hypothetical protein [Cytophagaceae bacterium]|tara:strand:- start:500 stop:1600 length:1101 start_codon:yes stop_codon:yes gene_type:complete